MAVSTPNVFLNVLTMVAGMYRYVVLVIIATLASCSPARRINHALRTETTYTDHLTGVSVYDPTRKKYLIQHNADRLFTPASNTKLLSFYAGLLFLPDSLPALRYVVQNDSLVIWGTGNPLLLHPDLPDTSTLAFLRGRTEPLIFSPTNYTGPRFGAGWAWDDYSDDYSPELSPLPIYGNVARFRKPTQLLPFRVTPSLFTDSVYTDLSKRNNIRRDEFANRFWVPPAAGSRQQDVPFRWSPDLFSDLLSDTLHRTVTVSSRPIPADTRLLRSQLTDSLYKRMLHVSDNQFAEQLLFMISAERGDPQLDPVGMRRLMIDSVLHYPAASVRWVDGSGLSRYNLFTPNVFVDLVGRIWARVPQHRLFALLPSAGQSGTLRKLGDGVKKPYVWAKSGSMTGVYNLSGYIQTRRDRLLYFSIMNNNFSQTVSELRKRTADLLRQMYEQL
jgi:D-alanyl-D-alanine carboxypeptidase/D-alanyl-D-alanine-endopeptidase (penicillin-binding protein 4)